MLVKKLLFPSLALGFLIAASANTANATDVNCNNKMCQRGSVVGGEQLYHCEAQTNGPETHCTNNIFGTACNNTGCID